MWTFSVIIFSMYLLPFLLSFVLSLFLTKFLIGYGLLRGWVSKPRKGRDIHKKAVPRIGGIGILIAFLTVTLITFLIFEPHLSFNLSRFSWLDTRFWGIVFGGFFISVVMLIDDLFGLSAVQKLAAQVGVAFLVIVSGIGIDTLSTPFGQSLNLNSVYVPMVEWHGTMLHFSLWSDLLTLVWLVGMMNVVNFIDGVDGLAGGISSVAFLTVFLLSLSVGQPSTAMVSIILLGSTLGFLVWNFPPAKIFMGDSGSMFLGFMLGVLPLISGGKLATAFLVLGFPIIDGLFVAISRALRGKNPLTTPDKTHLHHRFLGAGFTPRQAVISLYLISALFGWVALRASTMLKLEAAGGAVILIAILILVLNSKAKSR